jgi:hypothetical protein
MRPRPTRRTLDSRLWKPNKEYKFHSPGSNIKRLTAKDHSTSINLRPNSLPELFAEGSAELSLKPITPKNIPTTHSPKMAAVSTLRKASALLVLVAASVLATVDPAVTTSCTVFSASAPGATPPQPFSVSSTFKTVPSASKDAHLETSRDAPASPEPAASADSAPQSPQNVGPHHITRSLPLPSKPTDPPAPSTCWVYDPLGESPTRRAKPCCDQQKIAMKNYEAYQEWCKEVVKDPRYKNDEQVRKAFRGSEGYRKCMIGAPTMLCCYSAYEMLNAIQCKTWWPSTKIGSGYYE